MIFGVHATPFAPTSVAIALLGAFCSGAAYATVRRLGSREHPSVVVFYLPLVTFPIAIPFATVGWRTPSVGEWALLLAVGLSTQLAQVYMTRGLQAETAARATTTGYLQIVFAGIWGALLLGERPSAWTVGGALIIVSSTVLLALGRSRVGVGDE